ncbi:MAG: M23 family metallopeptidase [Spirochaetaceae bacterium]|jgi:hypothetical protein|nr:M23 family metallopeptidase [Spirochaetaceae bacterium]
MKNRTLLRALWPGLLGWCILLGGLTPGNPGLFAIDWPSADAKMTGNFGRNDEGRPLLGVVFEGPGPIRAADQGELLYAHSEGDTASRLPSPLGAWIALDHGDGIVSIYSRFEEPGANGPADTIHPGRVIASAGQSGWSRREGFYFSVFDRKERRWINPSMIITPQAETEQPLIQSVELKNDEGQSLNPAQVRNISQGHYTILVNASVSPPEGEPSLAPYRILCSVNGIEIGALNFETFAARDGALMVYRNGLVPVKQVYAPYPGFEVGEIWFTRGQATLEVIAQGIRGTTRSLTFRLQVD